MKRFFKIIGWFFLLVFIGFVSVNLKWVVYGVGQAKGQWKIVSEAVPVFDLLEDPSQPDSLKKKLVFIDSVKRYAHEKLGLAKSNIYNSIYDQQGKPVMYVVVASEKFRLNDYKWNVPLAGEFPYLGFFDKEKALMEETKLREAGYDVRIRIAEGWSTLGYLPNPLLSENLGDLKGNIANLIIHEITHETVYWKDSTSVNENLASFIADAGTRKLLLEWYSDSTDVYHQYNEYMFDYDRFSKHMIRGAHYLDSVYNSFGHETDTASKINAKSEAIRQIMQQLDTIPFYDPDRFSAPFKAYEPDNSFFMSFLRYRSSLEEFYDTLQTKFSDDLNSYIDYLKSKNQ